jgi:hypothetical protein
MKKLYLFTIITLITVQLNSQSFDWAKREGLWAYDYGYGIANDNSGNVYVAGKYELNNANFSGITVSCVDNHDIFLAKYDPSGAISWVTTAGGPSGDYAESVSCDGSYLYVAGEIEGFGDTVIFQNSITTLTAVGFNDIFVAKYDLNGALQWAKHAGWWHNEKALGVAHDNSGNVYICGFYNDTTYFESNMVLGTGGNDIFLAKYDASGNFQWVKTAGSAGRDEAKSIHCDAAGNVYVCGMHSDACTFGSQVLSSPNNYYNAFIAKYAADGTLLWANSAGGDVDDVAWSMTLDNAGKIYISGEYNAYATFGPFWLQTVGTNADVFIACYDQSGSALWVKSAGGTLIDRARGIGSDGTNLFITGQFGGTASFDSYSLTAADSSDVFIAALNNSGSFTWAIAVGGVADSVETLGYESGNAVSAMATGEIYATGAVLDGGIFGSTSYPEYGRTDIFVTRISQPSGINSLSGSPDSWNAYPNPSTGIINLSNSKLSNEKISIAVFNQMGDELLKKDITSGEKPNIDLSSLPKGMYSLEINGNSSNSRKKIVIQ